MKARLIIIIICFLLTLGIVISGFSIANKEKKAKDIVFKDANVLEKNINYLDTNLELDDFKLIYELEFVADNLKYEYEIDLIKGKIISKNFTGQSKELLSNQDKALDVALKDANVSKDDVDTIIVNEDNIDNVEVYEIEFAYKGYLYEYKIDKQGKIVGFEKEKFNR